MKLRKLAGWCVLAGAGLLLTGPSSFADETTGEKIENRVDEAKKDFKKSGRKAKRNFRHATGRDSLKEDIKDAGKDIGDELDTGAKKIKRKAD